MIKNVKFTIYDVQLVGIENYLPFTIYYLPLPVSKVVFMKMNTKLKKNHQPKRGTLNAEHGTQNNMKCLFSQKKS